MKRDKNGRFVASRKKDDKKAPKADRKTTKEFHPTRSEGRGTSGKRRPKPTLPHPVVQPDSYTCGPAAVTWALMCLGYDADYRKVEKALHTKRRNWAVRTAERLFGLKGDATFGTLPTAVVRVMRRCGYDLLVSRALSPNYVGKALDEDGVVLVGYVTKSPENRAHWVAVAFDDELLEPVLMDPSTGSFKVGEEAVMGHEAFGRVRARCALAFLP